TETILVGVIESWNYLDGILTLAIRQNLIDWSKSYPNRRLSYFCPYTFKDSRCKYVGAQGFCDKTFTTCQSFGNQDNFGGFKTLPRLQRGKWQ
ncbi:MAG: phage BR0599 family protein, partial [Alphaproteobacteria bacterium]